MKNFNLLILLLLLINTAPTFAAAFDDAQGDPGEVDKILAEIAAAEPGSGPAEYIIRENDFNAWLNLKASKHGFINEAEARFGEENEASISLTMEISKYQGEGYYTKMLDTMFEGEQHLKVGGKIKAGDGKFSFVVNSLTINEVIVTPALVYPLVSILLPEYNLDKPLELPYGLQDVRTEKGFLKLIR